MMLHTDSDNQATAEAMLRAAGVCVHAAHGARTNTVLQVPAGVASRLSQAAEHLLRAVWATRHGAGQHGPPARGRRHLWMRARLWQLRRAHREPVDAADRAALALELVTGPKSRTGTLGFHPALTTGLVHAWLLLGQVDYAITTGIAIEATTVPVPETADNEAHQVTVIADLLQRVVVTMIAAGNSPALAAATGAAALAHEEMTDLVKTACPRQRRGRLDLADEPLDLPPQANARALKHNASQVAAYLQTLSVMTKETAAYTDADAAWRRAMAARLRRIAGHLSTATDRITAWADNL